MVSLLLSRPEVERLRSLLARARMVKYGVRVVPRA